MSDHEASDEPRLARRIRAAYEKTAPLDPAARARLADALRTPRIRRPLWASLIAWLEPRPVTLRPTTALAAAVALVAAGVLLAPYLRAPRSTATPETSAAAQHPVHFVLVEPHAAQVSLVGDFNGWDASATPMRQDSRAGDWTATVWLAPGWHSYAYVVDGHRWVEDPTAPLAPPDDFGLNRSVVVVEEDHGV